MKILQVQTAMNIGGIETFLMNVLRKIDKTKYEFIFLTYRDGKFDYEDEIEQLGCKIIRISDPKKVGFIKHTYEIFNIIKQEKIEIVHCHTYFDSACVMLAAFFAKVKIRISHSHTAYALKKVGLYRRFRWNISRMLINIFSTNKLACGFDAGKSLYGNSNFQIIPNGINIEDFLYNEENNIKIRKELNIEKNDFVIGHVGRFDKVKNHDFIIEIFKEIIKLRKNSKLVLVGDGVLKDDIKEKTNKLNLNNDVLFMGNRSDVNEILSSFDVFVFPSEYEGFPLTLVEAQANGVKSYVSSNISKETKLSNSIEFLKLEIGPKEWAKIILNNDYKRINNQTNLKNSKYSINSTINKLTEIYRGEKNA